MKPLPSSAHLSFRQITPILLTTWQEGFEDVRSNGERHSAPR